MAFENLKSTGITYLLEKLKTVFLQIKDAVKSVNGTLPNANGNITITTVPYSQNLESDSAHQNTGTFVQRISGGDSAVSDGDAWLMSIKGNSVHTGYVAESITPTLTLVGDDDHLSITINRDTFVSYVQSSGTVSIVYVTEWSENLTDYGITVTGDPVAGDTITIVYVKEVRGTITVANPKSFVSTGWNLYDHSNGYAKVVKYENGYRVTGAYTTLKFAATPTGTQSDVVITDGNFDIPSDGYIIVTGGNSSSTAIYATREDWTEGYAGAFKAYSADVINLTYAMETYFPNGLLKAGSVVDEINLNIGQAISRVERLAYTAENLEDAEESGREYEYDENYIYLARSSAVTSAITIDGNYSVDDHGIEYFTTTTIGVPSEFLYGNNLKSKLESDVLTISAQSLTATQKTQVQSNLGLNIANNLTTTSDGYVLDAQQGKTLNDSITKLKFNTKTASTNGNGFFATGVNSTTDFIISARVTSGNRLAIWRGSDQYLLITDTAFSPVTSTSMTVEFITCKRSELQ